MKNSIQKMSFCIVVSLFSASVSFAANAVKKHENTTPINNVADQGKKDNNAAVKDGSLTAEQGSALNHKDQKIENDEQKNADMRHGLVSRGDHAKFNKKAKHVNAQRKETIEGNTQSTEDQKSESQKK